ncbi:tellurite resistance/C4-dicarboxylate transporter family protein [Mycolicibacterium boenickei]|uniref:Tellurite resistance protein permease n=1 Tax=Mycolicibacterium boenickei TaxID=146017 RepID=A0AAX3A0M8_9MYCO|nr:tellurite resistance/C4-dicarboxylate transporter family protein [Mycolicibacterium boenickei]PEG58438.1 tellurite resistance protein permease [Mycolicibacterium boenickei]UNC01222.1 tellurite resistance/C4-dicarboxylate transporter family protein [Mycolicibacterium boenickei]BBX91081.1 tellurite resistance protein permease [Mycolicibacterium boenickei]
MSESAARAAVRTLHPGYFALVMATGIISIAMNYHGAHALSVILLWVAGVSYLVLVVLTVVRTVRYRREFVADLTDPSRGFAMFTFVAATCVVGTRLAADSYYGPAFTLLAIGWVAWMVLGYVVPWTAVLAQAARPVLERANGTWFIWVVASQSVAVLAAALQPEIAAGRSELALLAVFSWSVGIFLYGAAGIFVAIRMLVYPLLPTDLTPPYWVAMGATAITVVAGARIVEMADAPMVSATRGLIAGTSVFFWAFGTWLIPPLIAAGIWRHWIHRIPLRYDATLWSIVFPLGMYGVGGHYLGQADQLPIVEYIGYTESWIALAVWAVVFLAMLRHLFLTLRPGVRDASGAPLEVEGD